MWPQSRPMSAPTTNATSLANLAPRPDRIGALGAARLPAITIEAADLPEDVLALLDHHLLDLGGTYGDPRTGDPIQYDELRIEHDQGLLEIVISTVPSYCSGPMARQ